MDDTVGDTVDSAVDRAGDGPSGGATGRGGVVTLPNLVTVARLCCLPLFLWLLFGREDRAAAAWLLAGLGISDWVDGFLARRLGQVSELGKVLDPVADRLLFLVGAGGILIDGSVPTWFAVTVLVRETLVGGATVVLAALGARRIDVTWFGKAGTFGLMIAFPLFLAHNSDLSWADTAGILAWVAGIPGLALSLYAAVLYVPLARRALADGRDARQAAEPAV
ncbi:MAG TPA: CDP-alcohol phosphatidyltransferase family protein [Acidimicrobiales bacterium]|nr:CDP-alcohol phosphatidyltransferase family protein [Acidimicrobiales bacterium]